MTTDFTSKSKPEGLKKLLSLGLEQWESEEQTHSPLDLFMEKPGSRIGCYELKHLLGEGAMAVVYLAQQQQPVKRQVALKIIKPGMDSKAIIARFEAERQALALLDHPNIAHIYDAGATEDKRPYFAMEYVEGSTITDYCDRHRLLVKERLHLFLIVCRAVHHAHQKGIIHRDIKPSNILVSPQDGQLVPKVIDFGLAKAISGSLSGRTMVTEQGQLMGTPEYMSPEQADVATEDIDTCSDIYSLGVLLYVLLTGVLPFESETLRKGGIETVRKIICDTDPKTPSTRLTKLGKEAKKVAESRRAEVGALAKCLHRELEWIPLKAMCKERSERYQSASELAEDIENYLKGAPLLAGPPSTVYWVKKFARRNRALVSGIAAVLAVLLGAVVVSTLFALAQARARVEAENSGREARRQAHIAKAVTEFLNNDLFSSIDPVRARGHDVTVREILDKASDKIEDQFKDEPLVEASIRMTLAQTYLSLGEYEEAEPHFRRALELNRASLDPNDPNVAISMSNLAQLLQDTNRPTEAEPLLKHGAEIMENSYGPNHPNVATALNNLATLYHETNRLADAEHLFRRALAIDETSLEPNDPKVATDLNNLAELLRVVNRLDEAEPLYRRALAIDEQSLDKEHPNVSRDLNNLALLLIATNRLTDAEPMMRRALAIEEQCYGQNHPNVAIRLNNIAQLLMMTNRLTEAENMMRLALEIDEQTLGEDHPSVARDLNNLAELLKVTNRLNEAERFYRRALAIDKQSLGKDHPDVAIDLNNLATLLKITNRFEEAEQMYHRVLAINKKFLGEDHPEVARNLSNLAELLRVTKRYVEAEPMIRRALAIDEQSYDKDDPRVAIRLNNLALLLQDTNRLVEAEQLMCRALEILEKRLGPDHPNTKKIRDNFESLKRKMEEN